MKHNTVEVMTVLVIEGIKDELKELVENAEYTEESDSTGLREMAANCRNIIDTADALENLLLTAADEIDRIEIAAREANAVCVDFDLQEDSFDRSDPCPKEGDTQ